MIKLLKVKIKVCMKQKLQTFHEFLKIAEFYI